MKIIKNIEVPTGNILIVEGSKGLLECLSLGDYGKDHNIICDSMGLSRPLDKVEHTELLPLSEKWVITVSTQYGCTSSCNFCSVPKIPFKGNASVEDLINQVKIAISLHPEITHTKRLNVHFARMGEPTMNPNVLLATAYLAGWLKEKGWGFHPVVSTMMPYLNYNQSSKLEEFINSWVDIKNNLLNGEAGLQISVNSSNENERDVMFNNNQMDLEYISDIMENTRIPKGRKYTLNFAIADWEIDPNKLRRLFNPDKYLIKLTPMHKTSSAIENGIVTKGDYTTYHPYKEYEEKLKAVGYEVLVFIASKEEDESCITCGNLILGGDIPKL